jgi:hypothetical protein
MSIPLLGPPLLAVSGVGDAPIKILAVVGGAVIGGLVLGWLTYLFVRAVTTQKLPPRLRWVIHVLGGIASGWVVYLWLFGGGGGGLGGSGGWWGGGGSGQNNPNVPIPLPKEKEKDKEKDGKGHSTEKQEETLRVEVLGDEPLRKITGSSSFDPDRRYRLDGASALRTLEDVKKVVRDRLRNGPGLKRVQIVVYLDSPARDRPQVADLASWLRDLEASGGSKPIAIDFEEPGKKAPVE